MFLNMPVVRQKFLSEFQQNRQTFIDEFVKNIQGQEQTKSFAPVAKTVAVAMADMAQQFMKDSEGLVVSGNIDAGGDPFSARCAVHQPVAMGQNDCGNEAKQSVAAGWASRPKIFCLWRNELGPTACRSTYVEILDPIRKDLVATNDQGKQIAMQLMRSRHALRPPTGSRWDTWFRRAEESCKRFRF